MSIVVKYYIESMDMTNAAYEEISRPEHPGRMLSKSEARERIRELGLVKVHENRHGTVWDTPAQDFLAKYGQCNYK